MGSKKKFKPVKKKKPRPSKNKPTPITRGELKLKVRRKKCSLLDWG